MGIALIRFLTVSNRKPPVANESRKGIYGNNKSVTYGIRGNSPGLYCEGGVNFIKIN